MGESICENCKHFREHQVKGTRLLDGHCELHSFSAKHPDEYFDIWGDSSCRDWEGIA